MPSEMMRQVMAAEQQCDEKKAQARAEAAALVAEAEKKAAAMRKEAAAFAKAKKTEILKEARALADTQIRDKTAETEAETAALKAASQQKLAEAVRQTALYLLELS